MNKKLKTAIWIVWTLIIATIIVVFILWSMFIPTIKKPAIYLYPEEDGFVDVSVVVNGRLTETIPDYDEGWEVFVTKDGLIEGEFDYLFYEASLKKLEVPEEGWVVEYENLEKWFDINLIELGLNEKEKNQFKEYWLEELPESKYYMIKILSRDFLEENMRLEINPQPDSILRLNFYFKVLDEKEIIQEPNVDVFERKGFVVVEWGGVLD